MGIDILAPTLIGAGALSTVFALDVWVHEALQGYSRGWLSWNMALGPPLIVLGIIVL